MLIILDLKTKNTKKYFIIKLQIEQNICYISYWSYLWHERFPWISIVMKYYRVFTISVTNSTTKSSRRSTLSVYGFWSSPNPYIIHRSSLANSLFRPPLVAPASEAASTVSSSSNWKLTTINHTFKYSY